jgi:hypothetical protein
VRRPWQAVPVAETDYSGQHPLLVTVVPARAAYLVRADSRDGFRRAVQEASSRWAGITEPIVPVHSDGTISESARTTVTLARVDGAVNVDLTDDVAQVAAATLNLDCVPLAEIDRSGITRYTCHPTEVGPVVLPDPALLIAEAGASLWQATAAGDLTAEDFQQLQQAPPPRVPLRRAPPDDIGRAQLHPDTMPTLLHRTLAAFDETVGSHRVFPAPTIVWVTEPDDLQACWDFWNTRALAPVGSGPVPMILLPLGQIHDWIGFDKQFGYALGRRAEFTPDVLLTSTSVPTEDLDALAELLHLQRTDTDIHTGEVYSSELRTAPFTYRTVSPVPDVTNLVSSPRRYGTTVEVDVHVADHATTLRFPSPIWFRGGRTLVRVEGTPFAGLPPRAPVARLIASCASVHEGVIQLTASARSDFVFRLGVPSLAQATEALLADATERYQLSSKGSLATGIQRDLDLTELRHPGLFPAIKQLTTPRTEHFLQQARRQFQGTDNLDDLDAFVERLRPLAQDWGARSERKMLPVSQLAGGATQVNVDALERLCRIGWAERGLRIDCTNCRLDSFVSLDDVPPRGGATCRGCGTAQRYASERFGISMFYRLDSLVDRANDQGVPPHLIAIAELQRLDPRSWFLPGVDAWFADRDNPLEVDLFGIHASRVAAGEVKASGTDFTEVQITRDIETCARLGADIYVMAAMDTVPDQARATASSLCEDNGLDLIVLTDINLFDTTPPPSSRRNRPSAT